MQNNVGSRFKKARKILNLSQEELANSLGITKQAISNIENSKSMPSLSSMSKLATEYNINLNYIIADIGEVYVTRDKNYKSLKKALLEEVDEFLKARGI